MNKHEAYQKLGLSPGADEADVKKAYRRMATKHHPDKGGNEEEFKKIKEAYERISEPEKFEQPNPFGAGDPHADIFSQIFRNMHGRQGGPNPFHGFHQPARFISMISLEEAAKGGTRQFTLGPGEHITVDFPKGCPDNAQRTYMVNGGQQIQVVFRHMPHSTFTLDGSNLVTEATIDLQQALIGSFVVVSDLDGAKFNVRVPAGSQPGSTLKLVGKGFPKASGKGDLLVRLKVVIPRLEPEDAVKIGDILDAAKSV